MSVHRPEPNPPGFLVVNGTVGKFKVTYPRPDVYELECRVVSNNDIDETGDFTVTVKKGESSIALSQGCDVYGSEL